MAITDWPATERPREKLLHQGPAALSDAELLAIFLRTGCAGKSAVDLARELLRNFDGLRPLLEADQIAFCQAKGLGSAKFAQLQAVLEMGRRHLRASLGQRDIFKHADQVKAFLMSQLRHLQRETFAVIYLDSQHALLSFEEMFVGSVSSAEVHPREVAKRALQHNAAAVILAHNHPSGLAHPSQADRRLTDTLCEALSLFEIRVLDHMIIGDEEVCSMAQMGWIKPM